MTRSSRAPPPRPSQGWLENVRRVLHVITLAVRLRPEKYSADKLQSMMLMVASLSTDHVNCNDELTLDVKACLVSIFYAVEEEQWIDWVSRLFFYVVIVRSLYGTNLPSALSLYIIIVVVVVVVIVVVIIHHHHHHQSTK